MFCPRCGRAVNETSNFCGGCGLSKAEIEKYLVKTEAAQPQSEPETEPQTVHWESQPAQEVPEAEPVKAEAVKEEPGFAENEIICEAAKETEAAKAEEPKQGTYSYTASQSGGQYSYSTSQSTQQSHAQPNYSYTEPVKEAKNENLSTVDFIWMMVIAGIPVVGLVYLIYLAFQNDNTNKRSYARASLIMSIFAFIISFVFVIGFMLSGM
ncbi:MAG: zinc ribbon domain-containing protein [Ruminococcaceae bacterium]|nr:zinc ribbon domain-containing protein [Oscillospiraceae bacterium]